MKFCLRFWRPGTALVLDDILCFRCLPLLGILLWLRGELLLSGCHCLLLWYSGSSCSVGPFLEGIILVVSLSFFVGRDSPHSFCLVIEKAGPDGILLVFWYSVFWFSTLVSYNLNSFFFFFNYNKVTVWQWDFAQVFGWQESFISLFMQVPIYFNCSSRTLA